MMSNILVDIVDDVVIKPSKLKLVLKWVISISISTIVVAFTLGQIKAVRMNRLNSFEQLLNANTDAMIELRQEMKIGFEEVNTRIDKVYDDGYKAFNDFQQYNNKQLGLIVDYGNSNKDLLKRMLEINTLEKTKSVETGIEQAKKESYSPTIIVKPIKRDSIKK